MLILLLRFIVTYSYKKLKEVTASKEDGIPSLTLYQCKFVNECQHPPFKYKSFRNRHEKTEYNYDREKITNNVEKPQQKDYKFGCMKASLSFNLLLRDINDAIKEGDGLRLIDLYKMSLLYYKAYHHTKYSYSLLKLLFRIRFQPQAAFQLTWGRFINTTGKPGRNISCDLHLKHLNNYLKELLKNLRSNLNEENADHHHHFRFNVHFPC